MVVTKDMTNFDTMSAYDNMDKTFYSLFHVLDSLAYSLLQIIFAKDTALTLKEIKRELKADKQQAIRRLNKLKKHGLVTRDFNEDDLIVWSLTERGLTFLFTLFYAQDKFRELLKREDEYEGWQECKEMLESERNAELSKMGR